MKRLWWLVLVMGCSKERPMTVQEKIAVEGLDRRMATLNTSVAGISSDEEVRRKAIAVAMEAIDIAAGYRAIQDEAGIGWVRSGTTWVKGR